MGATHRWKTEDIKCMEMACKLMKSRGLPDPRERGKGTYDSKYIFVKTFRRDNYRYRTIAEFLKIDHTTVKYYNDGAFNPRSINHSKIHIDYLHSYVSGNSIFMANMAKKSAGLSTVYNHMEEERA